MITRIVKLEFQANHIGDFLAFFETIKHEVNSFPGCNGMQLLQDMNNPCIVFTYSLWNAPSDLDAYRNSKTFGQIWPTIKPWFAVPAQAWSVNAVFNGFNQP